jgi:hypothetical protein
MNSFIKSGPRAKITKVCSSFTMAVTNIDPRRPPLQCPLVFEEGPHTKRRSTHFGLFGFFPFGWPWFSRSLRTFLTFRLVTH